LRRLFEDDDARYLPPDRVPAIRAILSDLDVAVRPEDLDAPGYGFHRLKGNRHDTYSVRVSRNWRITFRFPDRDAEDVDLEDYH
jgi:proteic killer suppression protein